MCQEAFVDGASALTLRSPLPSLPVPSVQVAVGAKPRLQRFFENVEDGVGHLTIELALQRRALKCGREIGTDARGQGNAADGITGLALPFPGFGRRRLRRR